MATAGAARAAERVFDETATPPVGFKIPPRARRSGSDTGRKRPLYFGIGAAALVFAAAGAWYAYKRSIKAPPAIGQATVAATDVRLRDRPASDAVGSEPIIHGEVVEILEVGARSLPQGNAWLRVRTRAGRDGYLESGVLRDLQSPQEETQYRFLRLQLRDAGPPSRSVIEQEVALLRDFLARYPGGRYDTTAKLLLADRYRALALVGGSRSEEQAQARQYASLALSLYEGVEKGAGPEAGTADLRAKEMRKLNEAVPVMTIAVATPGVVTTKLPPTTEPQAPLAARPPEENRFPRSEPKGTGRETAELEKAKAQIEQEKRELERVREEAEARQTREKQELERLRKELEEKKRAEDKRAPLYQGPSSGVIVWEGQVRGVELVTIEEGRASSGRVIGSLPGVACLVQPADPKRVVIATAPSPSNQFRRLVLRVSGNGPTVVRINWSLP